MKIKKISALLTGVVLSYMGFSQVNNTLINDIYTFQKLKVTQESVFQGKVFFDNGLSLNGDARFLNNIVGDGALNIAKSVRFSGLPENPTINYIITGDVNGDLGKVPLVVLARELESTLKSLNELTVKDATTLKGQLTLGDGLQINGAANFAGNVLVQNNLAVNGTLNLKGLPVLDSVPEGSLVLGIGPDGKIIILPGGPVFGWPGTPCFGGFLAKPAIWESSVNKLVTDKCSNDIKVGIGTQSPTERLEVSGHVRVNGAVFAGRKTAGYPTNHEFKGTMLVGGNGYAPNEMKYVSFGFDGTKTFINSNNPDNGGLYINAGSNLPVIIGSNNTSVTVNGGFYVKGANGYTQNGHTASVLLGSTNSSVSAIKGKGVGISSETTPNAFLVSDEGKIGIGLGLNKANARLEITSNTTENAIQVNSNSDKQFVVTSAGVVWAKEVNVSFYGFPDYVFKPEYKLMSLAEIEDYIDNNGHLPNMPSAAEVEAEGGNVADLIKKLVEKNEELTLHLIQMNKELQDLKSKIK